MDGRLKRREAVDGIREAIVRAGNPDRETVDQLFRQIQSREYENLKELFSVASAIRNAIAIVGDEEWVFKEGLRKANKIRIPGAVIISDSAISIKELQDAMDGVIFVHNNRAVLFYSDELIYCDVSLCNPLELAALHNQTAIDRMEQFLTSKKSGKDPETQLNKVISQLKHLSFDHNNEPPQEFDIDEQEGFFSNRMI